VWYNIGKRGRGIERMSDNYIAHVRKDLDDSWATPHSLSDHLKMTAKMAGKFAGKFNSEEWGKVVSC
jgi:CRISPR-associated endonuclease/helicase Cas3